MTNEPLTGLGRGIRDALDQALRETGAQLTQSTAAVATYTAERAAHLAGIAGEPGFAEAVVAERNAVALFAGIAAVRAADAADARVLGLIHGALAAGAAALS